MSLIPTVYRSTDPGAPVLSGTAGSFAALMDAVLVNGYGTGPDAKPGLGWVRAFSDGHKRAYQNSLADGGTGMFWRIDDSNAQYVLNSCYHTMSDIDTGIDAFGHVNNAWGKSISANTTARAWVVVGNSRTAYVFLANGAGSWQSAHVCFPVGDYGHINPSYAFAFMVARTAVATVTSGSNAAPMLVTAGNSSTVNGSHIAGARSYDGGTINQNMETRRSLVAGQQYPGGYNGLTYPYPVTGGMVASQVTIAAAGVFVGFYPGMYAPEHPSIPFSPMSVQSNIAGLVGEWFVCELGGNSANGTKSFGLLQLGQPWYYTP